MVTLQHLPCRGPLGDVSVTPRPQLRTGTGSRAGDEARPSFPGHVPLLGVCHSPRGPPHLAHGVPVHLLPDAVPQRPLAGRGAPPPPCSEVGSATGTESHQG